MKYVLGKAGKRIGMLGRIMKNVTMHCGNTIYVSVIRPVLDREVGVEPLDDVAAKSSHTQILFESRVTDLSKTFDRSK